MPAALFQNSPVLTTQTWEKYGVFGVSVARVFSESLSIFQEFLRPAETYWNPDFINSANLEKVDTVKPAVLYWHTQVESLKSFLAERIMGIEDIENIFFHSSERGEVDIWILTTDYDFDRNDQIYERQSKVYEAFYNVHVEFHIIPRQGRDIGELVPVGAEEVKLLEHAHS